VKPPSIKLRLSLLASLLAVSIILVISVVAYVELEESLLRNTDEILRAMSEGILATLDEHEGAATREIEFKSIIGNDNPDVPVWCRIWMDGTEEDRFSSGFLDHVNWAALLDMLPDEQPEVGQSTFFSTPDEIDRDEENPYRVLWIRRIVGGEVVNVLIGRSSHHVRHELTEFYQLMLTVGGSLTLLAFLAAPVLVTWGLRPITREAARLQAITHKTLRQHHDRFEIVPELKPFAAALDDMLVRLDKAMRQQEQFIADAAHELRTPVAVIKSTLQTARLQRRTAGEYEQSIDETLEDIARLERLTEQLLSLSRLEEANKQHESTDVHLDALLGEMVEIFDAQAAQQGGRVILSTPGTMWVRGNAIEMRQLFSNLLDNAIRHGPPRATVHVTVEDGPDSQVKVSVHDEGGQIPSDALAHLFDRFYRVGSSRAQASGGSGLGLAIAREITRRHGGDLQITSSPQTGTIASVRLPKA